MIPLSPILNTESTRTRRFTPLVIYHDDRHLQRQKHQTSNDDHGNQISMRRSRIYDMLNRNAQWWAHQEKITQTTLSGHTVTPSYKRGFIRTAPLKGNKNDIDMLTSSSTSSTSSNSSSDSNDSIATTPTTASTMMSMSTLMISPPYPSAQTSSPPITPMEPKTDMPPPPLYQTRRSFDTTYQSYHQKQFNRSHRHSTAGIYHHHQQAEPPFILTSSASASTPLKSSTSLAPPAHKTVPQTTTPSPSLASPILNDPYSLSSSYDRTHLLDTEKNDYYDDSESTNLSAIPLPSGHTTFDTKLGLKKRRRGNLPKHVTEYLKGWLLQHKKHPYPTERQKLELAQRTGLAVNQISNWFINARRRILQPMLETEQLFAKQQQHHYSHSRFLSSNLGNPTNPSTSALATTEDKKRRQLDIYAYHGFTDATHDTQGWSVRRTKLPNIEIPEKDQHIFATGH